MPSTHRPLSCLSIVSSCHGFPRHHHLPYDSWEVSTGIVTGNQGLANNTTRSGSSTGTESPSLGGITWDGPTHTDGSDHQPMAEARASRQSPSSRRRMQLPFPPSPMPPLEKRLTLSNLGRQTKLEVVLVGQHTSHFPQRFWPAPGPRLINWLSQLGRLRAAKFNALTS